MTKMDRAARKLLKESGLPWSIEAGKKHQKVRINGRMMMVLSIGQSKKCFDTLQIEAAIARARTLGPL